MANITLKNIRKAYDNNVVVKNVNIDIKDKEFIVLLGSSGCGKSTILRMIAGLEEISGGKLYIGDTLANDLNPSERGIAFVFQNYALYPHMTVRQNMAFALENMKFSPDEIKKRVKDAAEILKLSSLLERLPGELSGGQRQRVAIGRSIVRKPKVFLMDEPLSNLDAGLRARMREEILRLHNKLQTTFVYVTHDQTEAMTMAMRIILFEDGNIRQIGTPLEIYNKPIDKFVASFIGNPAMNFMDVNVDLKKKTLKTPGVNIPITEEIIHKVANYDGKN